jgi:two-component system KDP operon response regulator KdpE
VVWVCRAIRRDYETPIIVSRLPDEKTKVEALDQGADDYNKPFGMEELFARIRVATTRQLLTGGPGDR